MKHATMAAVLVVLAACGQGDPQSQKARANAPVEVWPPRPTEPMRAQAGDALKERLARQEAAAKQFDKSGK